MKKTALLFTVLLYGIFANAQRDMPLDTLYKQFEMFKKICDKDNGKLWGKSIYGSILVVDKISKMIVANQQDNEGQLTPKGNVYVGKYPENGIIACTATEFAGKSWAMISYPFEKKDTIDWYNTYVHESFHRIQGELGLACRGYDNAHMDKMDARIYLNLEWHALLSAINTLGEERNRAIGDALLFRQCRRQLFPGADSMENRFELHEGLASYTALKLCCNSASGIKENILRNKSGSLNNSGSCVRTFGYYSGLLYAYLLDETGAQWQKQLTCRSDLGALLLHLSNISPPDDTAHWLNEAKARYPYQEIYNQELQINKTKEELLSGYRVTFTQKPVLVFDLIKPTCGLFMSPRPLDTLGTVYPIIHISDAWGFLKVNEPGCLISQQKAMVTAETITIEGQIITGAGWELKLNDHWTIVKQKNNYMIQKKTAEPD